MDPGLFELVDGNADDQLSAIVRLNKSDIIPDNIRIISQFDEIATCRLRRADILKVHADAKVKSLKAPRSLNNTSFSEDVLSSEELNTEELQNAYAVQRPEVIETGRGVVVGIIDWGCDFAHPDFIDKNGESRLLSIWLQKGSTEITPENPYGRGRIIYRQQINKALETDNPYQSLNYHPGEISPGGGSHGTHTMSIAAGNGSGSKIVGMAPDAELVFVQADSSGLSGLANYGDSVTLLEAVDFIIKQANNRPCVINMSMGRHGGPHDGKTLVELGLDEALLQNPGLAIVNSTGNYFEAKAHASGQMESGQQYPLTWLVNAADQTSNELEVWYSDIDKISVKLISPEGEVFGPVNLDERNDIIQNGELVGRIYQRATDPNNKKNHIDIFLYNNSMGGEWQVLLKGERIFNGRFDAWIERDSGAIENQSHFDAKNVDETGTTGTIANGQFTISVGAFDARTDSRDLAHFSSSGPTSDNRPKPELVAPGVRIVAASSAPLDVEPESLVTVKSGTSMAAPHVAGTVALMYEAANRKLPIQEIRQILFNSTDDTSSYKEDRFRLGNGFLNAARAVENVRGIKSAENYVPKQKNKMNVKKETHSLNEEKEDFEMPVTEEIVGEYESYDIAPSKSTNYNDDLFNFTKKDNAEIFDNLVYGAVNNLRNYNEDFLVIAYPDEQTENNVVAGDIIIHRVMGEDKLADSSVIDSTESLSLKHIKLQSNSIIIRPQNQMVENYETPEDPARTINFTEPTQVVGRVTRIAGHGNDAGEREIEELINSLRASIGRFWDNYYQGLNNFETGMQFASEQETESRYFDVALKEVAKIIIDEVINKTLKNYPVLNMISSGIKNIAIAWQEESQRIARARGERRIAMYISTIRNEVGQPNGPHQLMLLQVNQARPRLLASFRQAVSQTQIPGQGQNGVLTGEAAEFIRQLREGIQHFQRAIPAAAYYTQMFVERFAGSRAWTRRVSHGGRLGGTLYLNMQLYKDGNSWTINSVSSSWVLATTAPSPERLATTLRDALHMQNKKIWQTRLPKMVKMRIEIEEPWLNSYRIANVRFIRNAQRFEIRSNYGDYGERLFRRAWAIPAVSSRALRVNRLRGSSD